MPAKLVTGFHGTSAAIADRVMADGFIRSDSQYEWLGSGIYFFEDAPGHALSWAKKRFPKLDLAVIRAEIDLGYCMNRLDDDWNEHIIQMHDLVMRKHRAAGIRIPPQNPAAGLHSLDCAVINMACAVQELIGFPVDTVRLTFQEGDTLYPHSAFHAEDHVQICVRKETAIQKLGISERVPHDARS